MGAFLFAGALGAEHLRRLVAVVRLLEAFDEPGRIDVILIGERNQAFGLPSSFCSFPEPGRRGLGIGSGARRRTGGHEKGQGEG